MVSGSGRETSDYTNTIKMTVGLGCVDDYPDYVKAGADELFIGYVPESWAVRFGMKAPLNRREVRYYNVQIGSKSELRILKSMIDDYGVPVAITLNALAFTPEQYPAVEQYIEACVAEGFDRFIIADPALLVYLQDKEIMKKIHIHISGEMGEINEEMIGFCKKLQADRMIFHRKVSLEDMKACMQAHPEMEYEAFILNEMCHFHGGFCNSLHCDELCHMCLVPYQLERKAVNEESDQKMISTEVDDFVPGATGCGLCALWSMVEMGMDYVKLVSRGNYVEDTRRDIVTLKRAIRLAQSAKTQEEYMKKMKKELFPAGCSGNCYYREFYT